jgi:hypothetical protein
MILAIVLSLIVMYVVIGAIALIANHNGKKLDNRG